MQPPKKPQRKRIAVFGSFDIIHPGHLSLLAQARRLGSVTVVLGRDSTIRKLKGREPHFSEDERQRQLLATGLADEVTLGSEIDPYAIIQTIKPDIILLGSDQKFFVDKLTAALNDGRLRTDIARAESFHPEFFKSSKVRPALENDQAGFLFINKPAGLTSHDIVARLRRSLNIKKIGHAGTLDPLATGLLIIGVNEAVKLLSWWHFFFKTYEVTLELGKVSDTYDRLGTVNQLPEKNITQSEFQTVLPQFIGTIEQTPPAHSAKKIAGQKAYTLARRGESVRLEPRTVTIRSLSLTVYRHPHATLTVDCSSGTYIRSLVHDIGNRLGSGAIMTELTRTGIGPIAVSSARPLEQITAATWRRLSYPVDRLLAEINKQHLETIA